MTRHPGGEEQTARLLEMAALTPPCRVLDMGAGDGETVEYLRALGFDAIGIDLAPGEGVELGDMLRCPCAAGSFDAVISQCAFFLTGDVTGAMEEAARLLRPGGRLLFSDVCFPALPATPTGLIIVAVEDYTARWREYYIERIWSDEAEELCSYVPKGQYRYYLAVYQKKEE